MAFWLVKSDPDTYSWDNLAKDKETDWDGVRNYQARNNLQAMKKGEEVLFYHSQTDKAIVGISIVAKEYFQDSTTDDNRWVAIRLKIGKKFKNPVTLEQMKKDPILSNIGLIKQSRLSVMQVTDVEFMRIVELSK